MSWPQNPSDPQQPPAQQPPQGFGPPPAWPPAGQQPQSQPQPPHQQPYPAPQYASAPPPHGPGPIPAQGHGYGYPTVPPPPPPPQRGRRTAYVVGGVVVALALAGGGIAVAMSSHPKKKDVDIYVKPSASVPAATPTDPAPTDAAPTEQGPDLTGGDVKPMYAGWQTQTQEDHGFRYDVPPAADHWKVISPSVRIAYTDKDDNPIVVMSGTSNYREGGCASGGPSGGITEAGKGQLATIGTQGSSGGTLSVNARNVAGNWGFAAYGGPEHKPKISVRKPVPWKHNGIDGYTATATVTEIYRPSPCVPTHAIARSISQRLHDGTISEWVIYADQGVPNALTSAEIDKIMSTVRPYTSG